MNEGEGEDEYRYRCLVRWVLKTRAKDRDAAYRWLNGYKDERGIYRKGWNELHPDSRLNRDVRDQWAKGNRGNPGEWK